MSSRMRFCVIYFVILCFGFQRNSAFAGPANTPGAMDLTILGSFNNSKIYYTAETSMNWQTAKAFCENVGMQLLSLDSDAEFEFLGNTLPRIRYWTSAKDTNTYKWNGGIGSTVSKPVHVFERMSCAVLFWSIFGSATLYGDPCIGLPETDYRPLCEAAVPGPPISEYNLSP